MHICILINTLSRRVSFGLLHVIIIFDAKTLFDGEDIVYMTLLEPGTNPRHVTHRVYVLLRGYIDVKTLSLCLVL